MVAIAVPVPRGIGRWWAHPGQAAHQLLLAVAANPPVAATAEPAIAVDADALVVRLFEQEGHSLVRLARLFVDDRNAAEDLVQEAFIRLARSASTTSRRDS